MDPKDTETTCKNCHRSFSSDYSYCPYCGQKKVEQITLVELFNNFVSNYFSVDGRLFKSIGPLLFKPGYLPTQFVQGKRETYLHPARMYMFVSIVFFFIFSFFIRETEMHIQTSNEDRMIELEDGTTVEFAGPSPPSILGIEFPSKIDSMLETGAEEEEIYKAMGMSEDAGFMSRKGYTQLLKLYREGGIREVYRTFFDSIPIAIFCLLPAFALILLLFYYRRGRYPNHLIFTYYYFSVVFILLGIIYCAYWWFNGLPTILDWLIALSPLIYLAFALKNFYGQSWKKTIVKEIGILFSFTAVFVPITFVLVIIYTFFYF